MHYARWLLQDATSGDLLANEINDLRLARPLHYERPDSTKVNNWAEAFVYNVKGVPMNPCGNYRTNHPLGNDLRVSYTCKGCRNRKPIEHGVMEHVFSYRNDAGDEVVNCENFLEHSKEDDE